MHKRLTSIPKWLILFFKILVSVLALGYVVWKLRHEEDNLLRAFTGLASGDYLRIAICFLLIFANQGIEAFKWMWMMRRYYPELRYTTAVQAILAGNTAGIVTPARVGEYAGRVMFLPEGSRIEALSLTLMDRISQLLVTIWVGVLSGVYLLYAFRSKLLAVFPITESYFFLFLYLIVGTLILVTFFLLNPKLLYKIIHPFVHKIPVLNTFVSAFQQVDSRTLLTIFSLSFCRACVFCSQYYLLLSAFGYETDFY